MSATSVVGTGMTKFGVHTKPLAELFADAAIPALDEAGVESDEVDALFLGTYSGVR